MDSVNKLIVFVFEVPSIEFIDNNVLQAIYCIIEKCRQTSIKEKINKVIADESIDDYWYVKIQTICKCVNEMESNYQNFENYIETRYLDFINDDEVRYNNDYLHQVFKRDEIVKALMLDSETKCAIIKSFMRITFEDFENYGKPNPTDFQIAKNTFGKDLSFEFDADAMQRCLNLYAEWWNKVCFSI